MNNMKPTKRLGFHFMRSYFDVLNKLENDADKLSFLLSIINKQFTDEDPKDLNFLVELCYESQRHAIEKSVKGWKTANKTDLLGNPTPPQGSPPTPPQGSPPKEEQVQGEVQVQEEGKGKDISPYALLEKEIPQQLETWLMQNKKNVTCFDDLVDAFNNTAMIEILSDQKPLNFESKSIFYRFKNFANSWIRNQKGSINKAMSTEETSKILRRGITF